MYNWGLLFIAQEYVWVGHDWIPQWQSGPLCAREVNWWIYTICLDCVSGCNPQWLQWSCPCLHQLGASLVHIISSWINADASFIQNLQSFRLLLLNKETSPQVWIWQHWLSEKRHRFGSECGIFWAFGKNPKCSYVLLYENSSKAEKIKKWKGGYMEPEAGKYGRIMCVPESSQISYLSGQNIQVPASPTALASWECSSLPQASCIFFKSEFNFYTPIAENLGLPADTTLSNDRCQNKILTCD